MIVMKTIIILLALILVCITTSYFVDDVLKIKNLFLNFICYMAINNYIVFTLMFKDELFDDEHCHTT